jgi:hypothetical protein
MFKIVFCVDGFYIGRLFVGLMKNPNWIGKSICFVWLKVSPKEEGLPYAGRYSFVEYSIQ